ncbi:MAG: T9SS type A sorting domain-containing protein [Bacteroidota bacterium]
MAQATGDCLPGTAEADLDVNDVRARLFNGGNLFFGNQTVSGAGYLVPKASGVSPIFNTELWVGGQVDGELRAAGAFYSSFEFWPGPLDEAGNPPADCSVYDRIFVVSRGDVARYLETGEATADLRDWPVELGAPVLDGDGVEGNYNLGGGDEPAISGEQMAWWVMNDAGNTNDVDDRTFLDHTPLYLEVQVSAFAVPAVERALDQATLYRYRLHYKGRVPLDSAYVGWWSDVDLGDASDDYVGADTTLDMSFVYNQSEVEPIYGIPPAAGTQLLQGPIGLSNGRDDDRDGIIDETGERLGVTSSACYFDNNPLGPNWDVSVYNCLRGRWFGGSTINQGNWGYFSEGSVTTFGFPGDPVSGAYWSAENADGEGTSLFGGDFWMSAFSGPFRLEPGETEEIVFAIPFAQGTDRLDSVVQLRQAARFLQNAYDLGFFDPQRVGAVPEPDPLPDAFALSQPFPNPFGASASLTLRVPEDAGPARLSVLDALGREVAVLADGVLPPGERSFTLDGSGLASGVYLVRLATARQSETLRVVHAE